MTNRTGRRGRQALQVLHYVSSVGWLGVGFCQLTLNVLALTTGVPALRHDAHEIAHVFDRTVLTVLSLGAAVTGILLAVRTPWGLLRHWWVLVKLTLTVTLIGLTPFWSGELIRRAIVATGGPVPGPEYAALRSELLVSSVTIISTLLVVTVISVVKPWGRTPFRRLRVLPRRWPAVLPPVSDPGMGEVLPGRRRDKGQARTAAHPTRRLAAARRRIRRAA